MLNDIEIAEKAKLRKISDVAKDRLGIGGIGSNICIELLRLGVKKIIIVDNDKVEESNINR